MAQLTMHVNGETFLGAFNSMNNAIEALMEFENEITRAAIGVHIRNDALGDVVREARKSSKRISMTWRLEQEDAD